MHILDKIVSHKKEEVKALKHRIPEQQIEQAIAMVPAPISLKERLKDPGNAGIIAEFKRKSPSAGIINNHADITSVTKGYMNANCAGISILTDHQFFGGSGNDLKTAGNFATVPLLRKDFIVDTYQITEARALGASVILLISGILSAKKMQDFTVKAHELGMEVLVEVHSAEDIEKIPAQADIVGINNRNLKNFDVNLENALALKKEISGDYPIVAESGIKNGKDIASLKQGGFDGFLIGSTLMKQSDPGKALEAINNEIRENMLKA